MSLRPGHAASTTRAGRLLGGRCLLNGSWSSRSEAPQQFGECEVVGEQIWFLVRAGEGRKAWGCPFGGLLERRPGCVSRSPVFNGEGPAVGLKLPAAQEVLREPRTGIRMPKAASRPSGGLGLPQVSGTELPGKWMLSSTSCISGQNYALWCIFK